MNQPISRERASLYERFRLPYPRAAIQDLLDCVGSPNVVADIGAGTGQLARSFAEVASTIYAVEPESAMREVGSEALASCQSVTFVDGTAEQTRLGTDTVDLIVVGNAYHRFREESRQELLRILKPGGWVAVLHYRYLDQALTDALFSRLSAIDAFTAKSKAAWHGASVGELLGHTPTLQKTYRQSVTQDWEAFFGVARSGIESPERTECWFPQFEEINREVFKMFSINGTLNRQYETSMVVGQPIDGHEGT
jgi:ubiquinone/menaquinone biosynthesis C-methylase UbiE